MAIRIPAVGLGTNLNPVVSAVAGGWRISESAWTTVNAIVIAAVGQNQPSALSRPDDDGNGVWNGWSRSFISREDTHAPMQFGPKPPKVRVVKSEAVDRASRW